MYLVAEVGPCEGDIEYAKKCADAIKGSAPDRGAMKAQWYTSETLTTPSAPRYDTTPGTATTQAELFEKQLSWDEWWEVVEYCRSIELPFFPSVFSPEAIEQAAEMGISTMKIASGDITHLPLIEYAAGMSDHLVVSTGGANLQEVEMAAATVMAASPTRLTMLACHLAYPSTWKQGNLARINAIRGKLIQLFGPGEFAVGYSDHTPQFRFLDMLVALGTSMWEKHFTLSSYGFEHGDHSFAIDEMDLMIMEQTISEVEQFLGNDWVDMSPTDAETPAVGGARRSVHWAEDMQEGQLVDAAAFEYLRPANGLPPSAAYNLFGKTMAHEVFAGDLVMEEDVL